MSPQSDDYDPRGPKCDARRIKPFTTPSKFDALRLALVGNPEALKLLEDLRVDLVQLSRGNLPAYGPFLDDDPPLSVGSELEDWAATWVGSQYGG